MLCRAATDSAAAVLARGEQLQATLAHRPPTPNPSRCARGHLREFFTRHVGVRAETSQYSQASQAPSSRVLPGAKPCLDKNACRYSDLHSVLDSRRKILTTKQRAYNDHYYEVLNRCQSREASVRERALQMVDQILSFDPPDQLKLFTGLINACCADNQISQALLARKLMLAHGVRPDSRVYTVLFQAMGERARTPAAARAPLPDMLTLEPPLDLHHATVILRVCLKGCSKADLSELLGRIHEQGLQPDQKMYTGVPVDTKVQHPYSFFGGPGIQVLDVCLTAFNKCGMVEQAITFLDKIADDFPPLTLYQYHLVLQLAAHQDLSLAFSLYKRMPDLNLQPECYTIYTLLHGCALHRSPGRAIELWHSVESAGSVVPSANMYAALAAACASGGQGHAVQAAHVLSHMAAVGMPVAAPSCRPVLEACLAMRSCPEDMYSSAKLGTLGLPYSDPATLVLGMQLAPSPVFEQARSAVDFTFGLAQHLLGLMQSTQCPPDSTIFEAILRAGATRFDPLPADSVLKLLEAAGPSTDALSNVLTACGIYPDTDAAGRPRLLGGVAHEFRERAANLCSNMDEANHVYASMVAAGTYRSSATFVALFGPAPTYGSQSYERTCILLDASGIQPDSELCDHIMNAVLATGLEEATYTFRWLVDLGLSTLSNLVLELIRSCVASYETVLANDMLSDVQRMGCKLSASDLLKGCGFAHGFELVRLLHQFNFPFYSQDCSAVSHLIELAAHGGKLQSGFELCQVLD
eukprot:gene11252-2045_t